MNTNADASGLALSPERSDQAARFPVGDRYRFHNSIKAPAWFFARE